MVESLEGRWNLMVAPDGRAPGAAKACDEQAVRHGWSCVPVVPCDAAAVERVAICLHRLGDPAGKRTWSQLPGYHRRSHLEEARDVLRAAGSTDVV